MTSGAFFFLPLSWRLIRSRGVALWLLALLAGLALLGTIIPQQGLTASMDMADWQQDHPAVARWFAAAGLSRLYSSWWFIGLLALLGLGLTSYTISRARSLSLLAPTKAMSRAVLVRRWGSLTLHVAVVLVLAGALLSAAFRMSGYFELAQGQQFVDAPGNYDVVSSGPLFAGRHSGLAVRLDRFTTQYYPDGQLRDIASYITLSSPSGPDDAAIGRAAKVDAVGPVHEAGTAIYQTKTYGLGALLALRGSDGQTIGRGAVRFATPRGERQPAVGVFTLPGTDLMVHAQLFPVLGAQPKAALWRADDLPDAGLYLTVSEKSEAGAGPEGQPETRSSELKTLFSGSLPVGHEVHVGSYTLSFERVTRWSGFVLVSDPGVPVIFAGFGLCVLGAALLYAGVVRK